MKKLKKVNFSVHCHNDLSAVANSLQAIQIGANQVECTVNGIGERAGNASLEEIVMSLQTRKDLSKASTKIDTKKIENISTIVSKTINYSISPNKPIVGENAFAHESGIHQDGFVKNRNTYEIMTPEDVGVSNSKLYLSSQSGLAGIRYKLNQYNLDIKNINIINFVKFFKLKVKNFKRVDKGMLTNLYNEYKKKTINVCLSCVGVILIFDFIQSLKNQKDFKVSITGIDQDKNASGKVLCDKFYEISEPIFEKKYLDRLIKILTKNKIKIFFPLSDKECEVITKNYSYLRKKVPNTNFWVGKSYPKYILTDKEKFLRFCKSNKFYTEKYFILKKFDDFKKIVFTKKIKN